LVADLFRTDNQASLHAPRKRTTSRVGKSAPKTKKTVGSEVIHNTLILFN